MAIDKKEIACPSCGKKGTWTAENKDKPFCSPRCKLIDLGDWASEQHRIPGPPVVLDDELKDDEQEK